MLKSNQLLRGLLHTLPRGLVFQAVRVAEATRLQSCDKPLREVVQLAQKCEPAISYSIWRKACNSLPHGLLYHRPYRVF